MTPHSSTLGHDWVTSLSLFTFMHWRRKWQPIPVFLPGESQGQRNLVGCSLWGHTESDTTEATYQYQQPVTIFSSVQSLSPVRLFETLLIIAHQAPLPMGFSRQEHWSGLPCPPPGDLPDSGIEPTSLTSRALAGRFFTTRATWEAPTWI